MTADTAVRGRPLWLVLGLGWIGLAVWNVADDPRWWLAVLQLVLGVTTLAQYARARRSPGPS